MYKRETTAAKKIAEYLNGNSGQYVKIETVKQTGSTNEDMKRAAREGADEVTVLIADSQTKGKGSKGRSFFSPKDTGCYMSLLLRPDISADKLTLLTPMAAVAVAEAIESVLNISADIKWVNDIYIGGKKAAGILTEGSFSGGKVEYAAIGIGINLSQPKEGFPEEIRETATALGDVSDEEKYQLTAEIINRLLGYYSGLQYGAFLEEYRKRLFFLGRDIEVHTGVESYTATAEDIDSMCRLILRKKSGETLVLGTGEISIKV